MLLLITVIVFQISASQLVLVIIHIDCCQFYIIDLIFDTICDALRSNFYLLCGFQMAYRLSNINAPCVDCCLKMIVRSIGTKNRIKNLNVICVFGAVRASTTRLTSSVTHAYTQVPCGKLKSIVANLQIISYLY